MLWAEWWGGELNLFLAGLLCGLGALQAAHGITNHTAATSLAASSTALGAAAEAGASCAPADTFALLAQTMFLAFMTHLGFSMQGGAHLGNLLGANKPRRAATASQARVPRHKNDNCRGARPHILQPLTNCD